MRGELITSSGTGTPKDSSGVQLSPRPQPPCRTGHGFTVLPLGPKTKVKTVVVRYVEFHWGRKKTLIKRVEIICLEPEYHQKFDTGSLRSLK